MSAVFKFACGAVCSNAARATRLRTCAISFAGIVFALCPAVNAEDDTPTVDRIEEDWVVEIGTPDVEATAPQIITVMSPGASLQMSHGVFELNHHTQPEYEAGGMQLQFWYGEDNITYHNNPRYGALYVPGETITFTMAMSLKNGKREYEILNGTSTTWGTFGGEGYLKTALATPYTDFSAYSPSASVKNSGIGFAKHRVNRFALKAVRYYSADTLMATDSTERVVHQHTSTE